MNGGHVELVDVEHLNADPRSPQEVAQAVAAWIPSGAYVNLGIGQPTLVADFLSAEREVTLHTENGMLGMGPRALDHSVDLDLINAGKIPVTELPGAAYFHHADSFAMMRGGHLDVCVLGAFEVSISGDLANWHTGAPQAVPAVGGAMDLAIGAKQVAVMMTLRNKNGTPKLVEQCSYPLTGSRCVDVVFTDVATFVLNQGDVYVPESFGRTLAELSEMLGFDLLPGLPETSGRPRP